MDETITSLYCVSSSSHLRVQNYVTVNSVEQSLISEATVKMKANIIRLIFVHNATYGI